MKPFLLKSRIFGLGKINSWAFGVFSAELSAPIQDAKSISKRGVLKIY